MARRRSKAAQERVRLALTDPYKEYTVNEKWRKAQDRAERKRQAKANAGPIIVGLFAAAGVAAMVYNARKKT